MFWTEIQLIYSIFDDFAILKIRNFRSQFLHFIFNGCKLAMNISSLRNIQFLKFIHHYIKNNIYLNIIFKSHF